jgi:hydrogenase maturation factor
MKKNLIAVLVFIGMTAYVSGQQTYTKREIKEIKAIKAMLVQMYKLFLPFEWTESGYDTDCLCEVSADVTVDFVLKKYDNKTIDMSDFMEAFTNMRDTSSSFYKELMSMWETEIEKKCGIVSSSIIVNGTSTSSIPLLRYGNMYKLKVMLGTSSKYYLMDSGASMSVISKSYARELEKLNIITKESYIGKSDFKTANGKTVSCSVVVLNNVKIGDFTLDNVGFAIMDKDIDFLLGKNILDVFSSWHINNSNSTLELVK